MSTVVLLHCGITTTEVVLSALGFRCNAYMHSSPITHFQTLTNEMPGFSLAMSPHSSCSVGLVPDQRCTDSVRYLTDQQQHTRIGTLEAEHGVEVDQEIREPHRCAQVV